MDNLAVDMQGITKVFGPLKANDQVDFNLKKSSIHGLLGENGAGKTTLMNVLYGLYKPEKGKIFINGTEQVIDSPTRAMELGLGMVHQHFMLARPMTVTENIMLGQPSTRGFLLDHKKIRAEIIRLSELYNLKVDPDAYIWQLAVGEQQRVEILSAIFRGAAILILDEPTAVLTPQETEELFGILRKMKADGKSIILISHKLEEILSICDEVSVLRNGCSTGFQAVSESTTKQDLTRMMVGRDVLFDFHTDAADIGPVKVDVRELCADNDKEYPALNGITFTIHAGEILGLAGVDGNGQKELCEVLTGLRKATGGSMKLNGKDITDETPAQHIDHRISHIPEDRHKTGLVMNWDVAMNAIIKSYKKPRISPKGLLDYNEVHKVTEEMIKKFSIKVTNQQDKVRSLSGGNQQKLILARELALEPDFLIANQPTRGLDIGATEYVRQQLIEQKKTGCAVLLVSADLEEIKQISDRIAVIYEGEILGILDRKAPINEIGLLMAGVRKNATEA